MPEIALINDIVAALNKLKDTTSGRIHTVKKTHGQFEFGIDILFDHIDAFGQMRVYGVQVKQGDITVEILKDLHWQTIVAFGHQFSFPEEGLPRYLDAMYIVTDGQFRGGVSEHFIDAKVGFREVFIIDKDKLVPFLSGTLPVMDMTHD